MVPGVVQQLGGEAVVPAVASVVVDVVLLLARLYRPPHPRPGQHYCQYPAPVSTSSTTSAVIGDCQLKTLFHDTMTRRCCPRWSLVTAVSGGQTDKLVTQLGHL